MKVLFVYPNSGSQIGFNYGISSISAVLRKSGHETALIQLCDDIKPMPEREEFGAMLGEINPDLIGFSVVTNQWALTKQYASYCREFSDVPVVCGGIHASITTMEVLESGLFDFAFAGEAEHTFTLFVDALEKGEDYSGIAGLGIRDSKGIKINPLGPLPELKELPQKDYSIFDFQQIIDAKGGWVGLMASRGCPFNCTYCFNHHMVSRYRKDLNVNFKQLNYIRHHTVEQIISEILFLESSYDNICMYIFDDDLFTFKKEFVLEFCEQYIKTSTIPFVVNGHVGFWDEERAKALANAGCRIVKFGVESGSERIRKQIMHRRTTNRKIREALALVKDHGMHSSCFLMIGLPHETKEDVMDTVKLMAESEPGRFRWTFFYPFPGTESYILADKGGFIDFDKFGNLVNFTDESCLDLGPEMNLLLKKIGLLMPWFINSYSKMETASFYKEQVDMITAMNEDEWQQWSGNALELDKTYSERFAKEGKRHYAIKYNRFMGVISDYFLNE